LDKDFESKPIKEGDKIPLLTAQEITQILKQLHKQHVYSNHKQQHLHYSTRISKPIRFQESEQYGLGTNDEERKRRLVEDILQDVERDRSDDRHTKNDEGYQEIGRRSEYNGNGGRRNSVDS